VHENVSAEQMFEQMAQDLSWLARRAQAQGRSPETCLRLSLAAAIARHSFRCAASACLPPIALVAVIGGAGSGKSTVTNLCIGRAVAETNPQAGYTRHPIVYVSARVSQESWCRHLFGQRLQYHAGHVPADHDADIYQVRTPADAEGVLLQRVMLWDCPDMTTWQAQGYVQRLIEILGLADIVVFVASDERYNDEIPNTFLKLLVEAGKRLVVCLTKMRPEDAQHLCSLYREKVLAALSAQADGIPCLPLPHLAPEVLGRPELAPQITHQLHSVLLTLADPLPSLRGQKQRQERSFVSAALATAQAVVADELSVLSQWHQVVAAGRSQFEERFRREYLSQENFPRFNESMARLVELLEIPGLSHVMRILRLPWRSLKSLLGWARSAPAVHLPEETTLRPAFAAWLDLLLHEALRRQADHPLWVRVREELQGAWRRKLAEDFERLLSQFAREQSQAVEALARSIHEELAKNPLALNSLRGLKFTIEAGSVAGVVAFMGLNVWDLAWPFIIPPLVQELVELMGEQYVNAEREKARRRQLELLQTVLSDPLTETLVQWPIREVESLKTAAAIGARLPDARRQLETWPLDAAAPPAATG